MTDVNELETEVHEDEIEKNDLEFITNTLTGDLRNAMIGRYKQVKKPWEKMNQSEQEIEANYYQTTAEELVEEAVRLIAANGRKSMIAHVKKLDVGDKINVTLQMEHTPEILAQMGKATKKRILVVPADASFYVGQSDPAPIDPDQPDLMDSEDQELDAREASDVPEEEEAA